MRSQSFIRRFLQLAKQEKRSDDEGTSIRVCLRTIQVRTVRLDSMLQEYVATSRHVSDYQQARKQAGMHGGDQAGKRVGNSAGKRARRRYRKQATRQRTRNQTATG